MGIKVCVLIRDVGYRAALEGAIQTAGDMVCVGAYGKPAAALQEIISCKPDVVLMEMTPAKGSGKKVVQQLKAAAPAAAILVVAKSQDSQAILRALSAGAFGYLLRSSSLSAICDAVRQVHGGGAPLSPEIAPAVMRLLASLPEQENQTEISAREQQILDLLSRSTRNKEIAVSLKVSVPTVRTHLRTIYLKLRVSSRADAIRKLATEPVWRAAWRPGIGAEQCRGAARAE